MTKELQPWELTDDDYIKAVNAAAIGPYYLDSSDVSDIDRAIATSAQKRLVEWMDSVWVADFRVGSVTLPFEVADSLKAALGVK